MFGVEAAKSKVDPDDTPPPVQSSMRGSSGDKIRRNPTTDQRKIRRQMTRQAARDGEHYVVRGGGAGSYDVLSGPYDSSDDANGAAAMSEGASVISGTTLDASSIGKDYRMGSIHSARRARTAADQGLVKDLLSMGDGKMIFDDGTTFCHVYFDADSISDDYGNTSRGSGVWQVVVKDTEELIGGRRIAEKEFRCPEAKNMATVASMVAEYITMHLFRGRRTGSRRTAGYPDPGGYYPLDDPELTPEIQARMEQLRQRIEGWRGGDEDAVTEMLQHYNSLADEYGLPRYGDDTPHYASAPDGVYNEDGEPLGFDYSSDPDEDAWDDQNGDADFYDDFAHEASLYPAVATPRHAIADEFDLRPLHSRVATAFLKKG